MKTLTKLCLLLGLGLCLFVSSCENQTEGLVQPTPTAKDAPPTYIVDAIKLKYPNATDLKVTVLTPNQLWKVEFTVNGELFETFMDGDARWIASGRIAADDEAAAIKKIIAHWRGKYGKHIYTEALFQRIRDPYTRKVIYHYVWEIVPANYHQPEDNKLHAVLYDEAGNMLSEYETAYDRAESYSTFGNNNPMTHNIHFDIKTKQLIWIKYPLNSNGQYQPYPTTEPIMSTLRQFKWDDFSSISPVLQKEDYPVKVGDFQLVFWSWPIFGSLVDERETKIQGLGSSNGIFGTQFSWLQSTRLNYWKYFEEERSMPGLMTKLDGTPLYIKEQV